MKTNTEQQDTITVEIPNVLYSAVLEICNVKSTPVEFICQAIVDKLKKDIVKYNTAIGFAQRDLDNYEGIDKTRCRQR